MSAEAAASETSPADSAAAPRPAARRVICYSIHAVAEPGVMPRVLELFAKRNLVPGRWHSDLVGPSGDELAIDLQVADLDAHTADYIARCLRQIWGVETVLTSEKRFA